MGKTHRVSRLLEMVSLLQSGTGWRAAALAERFGVSRTRVFSDIRALREAGVPVQSTRDGYTIDPSFFLPSLRLTPQEVLALLFPMEALTTGAVPDHVHDSARSKLLAGLPTALREGAEELMRRMHVALPASGAQGELFTQLREAVVERRRVAIVYSGRTSDRLQRLEIDPYGLAFRKHAWYLAAYSVAHREVRTFRVSRIHGVEPTPLHFTLPADFSVAELFAGAWYVFSGRPQEIGLRFSPRVARLVRERVPHPGQQIQTLSDGTILYRAKVNDLDEVAWWLMQYGGEAVVVYPQELRDKVVALASSILDRYQVERRPAPRPYELPGDQPPGRVAEPGPEPPPAGKS